MSMELAFAKQEIEDLKRGAHLQRSATLNLLLDLEVMLKDEDFDEALKLIQGYTNE